MSNTTAPPVTLPVIPEGIPPELKVRPQWVGWRWVYRSKQQKWTKPPVSAATGKDASSTNPATWTSFEDALSFARSRRLPGIGCVVTRDDPYVGIDLDDCHNPDTHEIAPWAQAIIDRFDSYTELSPSGTGVRIIIRTITGYLPNGKDGRRKGAIEVYGALRYFTLTGHRLSESGDIADRTDELAAFYAETFGPPSPQKTPSPRLGSPALSDDEIIDRARSAANGTKFMRLWAGDTSEHGDDDSAADLALLGILAFWTQNHDQLDRLFRRSGLYREKWERADYRDRTIERALEREEVYDPDRSTLTGRRVESIAALAVQRKDTTQTTKTSQCAPRLVVTPLTDIRSKPIDWLWPRWLPRGKLLLLAGYTGDGKSTMAVALAAIGSRGGTWPDGSQAPQLRTLFLLGEDSAADTLRPRLDLHKANMTQLFVVQTVLDGSGQERFFNVRAHLNLLEEKIAELGLDLIVIDPITTIMPGTDRNAEGDTRDALTPLVKLAQRRNVAILGIAHVGKPTPSVRRAAQRILGATAFTALARVVWMIAPYEEQMVLGVVKSNLAIKPPPLLWSREEDTPICWDGMAGCDMENLFSPPSSAPRLDVAEAFLREVLKGGMKTAREVEEAAKAAGISMGTLRRAAEAINIIKWKDQRANGPWYWMLPGGGAQPHDSPEAA